jgi:hypothetical protein
MAYELACVMCMVDPQTTSMLVPMAQATVIAVPILFRSRIADAVRRAIRHGVNPVVSPPRDEGCDTRADDPADRPEPPGTLRP